MKKGSIILNRQITTQLGNLTAKKGMLLMSVFLGAMREGDEPNPVKRMEDLGWRQMAMFETSVRISIDHESKPREDFEWRLVFSCLGAVDAVEAAVRFANKMIADELDRSPQGTPAPYLQALTVGTIRVGPIADDGTPFNGRGPAFFGWRHDEEVSLEDHMEALRDHAKRLSK